MADSEVRQKFEATVNGICQILNEWRRGTGPGVGTLLMMAWDEAYSAGMRAGEIARWIPVEEKLPDKSGEYLVVESGDTEASSADFFIELPNVEKSKWMTVRSFGQDGESRELFNVTHWQPLPAAPESK